MLSVLCCVIAIIIIGFISFILFKQISKSENEFIELINGIGAVIIGTCALFLFFILLYQIFKIASTQINKEATRAMYQQRYNSIIYQLENNLYDGDDGMGNIDTGNSARRALYSDIESWNKDLAQYKYYSHSLWKNWFYPADLYNDFEYINYPGTVG